MEGLGLSQLVTIETLRQELLRQELQLLVPFLPGSTFCPCHAGVFARVKQGQVQLPKGLMVCFLDVNLSRRVRRESRLFHGDTIVLEGTGNPTSRKVLIWF